jgi:hypothetical protein
LLAISVESKSRSFCLRGGGSFDIGEFLPQDREAIPPARVRVVLRPLLLNTETLADDLDLGNELRKRLREESFSSGTLGTNVPVASFLDQEDFPGAIRATGGYKVVNKHVEVTVALTRDGADITRFTVEGSTDDLAALTDSLATQINKAALQ